MWVLFQNANASPTPNMAYPGAAQLRLCLEQQLRCDSNTHAWLKTTDSHL